MLKHSFTIVEQCFSFVKDVFIVNGTSFWPFSTIAIRLLFLEWKKIRTTFCLIFFCFVLFVIDFKNTYLLFENVINWLLNMYNAEEFP